MNGAAVSRTVLRGRWKRPVLDLLLLVALGLIMSVLGPYGTVDKPTEVRTIYWLLAVVGSGTIGIAIDSVLARRIPAFWVRILVASLLMTPPVTAFIYFLNAVLLDLPRRWWLIHQLAWQVLVVSLLVMSVRALVWRRIVETKTIIVPPLPEAERVFRMRLSPKRRSARLIALEADDHYVRVYTDAGTELLAIRFSEAVAELNSAYGYRLHRSWWASAEAIEAVRWKRGSGEVRLLGGIVAPVSRNYIGALRDAGWR